MNKFEPKQILVYRRDLKSRTGKIASQCAHASLKVVVDKLQRISIWSLPYEIIKLVIKKNDPLYIWLFEGAFTKICVYVNSEEELLEVYNKAKEAGIHCALIQDAGRTEFKGVPTYTCCAIGPDYPDVVDKITGELPLL